MNYCMYSNYRQGADNYRYRRGIKGALTEEPVAGDDRRADAGDVCGEAAGGCCSELV